MKTPKSLASEFTAGTESGKHPNPGNTEKAIQAVATRLTAPLVRAYWSGYLCQASLDNPDFLKP